MKEFFKYFEGAFTAPFYLTKNTLDLLYRMEKGV